MEPEELSEIIYSNLLGKMSFGWMRDESDYTNAVARSLVAIKLLAMASKETQSLEEFLEVMESAYNDLAKMTFDEYKAKADAHNKKLAKEEAEAAEAKVVDKLSPHKANDDVSREES